MNALIMTARRLSSIRPYLHAGWLILALGVMGALLTRPPTDNSAQAIGFTTNQEGQNYQQFRKHFGADEVVVAHLVSTRTEELLSAIKTSEQLLTSFHAITRVVGPSSAYGDVVDILEDPDLVGPEIQQHIRHQLQGPLNRSLRILNLSTSPARATIYGFGQLTSPTEWQKLDDALDSLKASLPKTTVLTYGGSPFLNLALDTESSRVEQTSVPLLALICGLLLYFVLKSLRLTLCILAVVGMGVLGAEGVYGLAGLSGNLVANVAKPLLFVILLANALHIAVAFEYYLRMGHERRDAAWLASKDKQRGLSLALLTTAVGFMSLLFAELAPIQQLGFLATGGLLAGAPLLLYGLPTLIAQWGPDTPTAHALQAGRVEAFLHRCTTAGRPYRGYIWLASVAAILLGIGAGFRLQPQTHPINFFPSTHAVAETYRELEGKSVGLMTLEALVTPPPTSPSSSGDSQAEDITAALDRWVSTATSAPEIRGRLDSPLLLREMNWQQNRRDRVPNPAYNQFLRRQSPEIFAQLEHNQTFRVAYLLKGQLRIQELNQLSQRLQASLSTEIPGAQLTLTGNFVLLMRSQRGLQRTLIRSLLVTLILMELTLLWALRSVKLALIALVPNMLPLAINTLIMNIGHIPLDTGTVMTGAITLGIAVDDTLHFLINWQQKGKSAAIKQTGKAILLSTLVMTCGFLALVPSQFLPTSHFALLTGTAMIVALVGDLLILPTLLPDHPKCSTP